ncbi:heterokaryon incompatibility protein-domain-containing protein [Immersiella caudata]|uniref:Heterokaryon incompatibility protein-domain-containing protein n=1 Tax=Immersiella caudata TaxID=314043 RepID=A0AA40C6D7_9PEZI|nr:heterokaryon incompatibility protein-domain-containing protein [Immersiella caudata]
MLSRFRVAQPIRTYSHLDGRGICASCCTEVFTSDLQKSLAEACDEPLLTHSYSRSARALHASVLAGCPWCTCIGNAVLSCSDLDQWMEAWNGSRSDGASLYDMDTASDGELTYADSEPQSSGKNEEGFDEASEAEDRDAASEEAGFHTAESLNCDAELDIAIDFLKWNSSRLFNLAEVRAEGDFRPTRLIDVRDPRHPRLTIAEEDVQHHPRLTYVALSYVWGRKQDYTLTTSCLPDMRKGLDPARLPETLSDAIAATHQLGFEYLWIDALCIIQDSPEDKALELPRMADTYRESELTLIIASAASASDGFLKTPSPKRFLLQPFEADLGLIFGYRAPYRASADPISSRAWTLQERVLSRRLLIFSSSGVMWMCREDFINPSAAPDAGPPYQTFLDPHLSADHPAAVEDDAEDAETRIKETWASIRADYTEMDLSYCSDKLPAISALATEIGSKAGWTYLAGIWKENLFSELHWRCMKQNLSGERLTFKPRKVQDAGYLAPSWSWASVGIGAIVGDDEGEDREVFNFSILGCQVDTIDPSFSYGPVKSGYLEVLGRTVELAWRYEDRPSWDGSDICLVEEGGTPLAVGDGTLDPLDEPLDPSTRVVCLGMSKLRLGRQRIVPVEGLILLPKGDSAFRRIGFFRMTAPIVFDEAATRILRIE